MIRICVGEKVSIKKKLALDAGIKSIITYLILTLYDYGKQFAQASNWLWSAACGAGILILCFVAWYLNSSLIVSIARKGE